MCLLKNKGFAGKWEADCAPGLLKQGISMIRLRRSMPNGSKAKQKDSADSHWVVVLDNVMNRRTCELMSTHSKARAACNTIRERKRKKEKEYAELEAKCNDALQDLEKNPLVLDVRAKVMTL
ncbi:hypothetical protein Tco_0617829 [Tanacetum coccineum]